MLFAALIVMLSSMGLLMFRCFKGESIFDRILAVNNFGTNVVVLIVLIGLLFDTPFFIDVALIYALINFVTTIAVLRYFNMRGSEGK